MYASLLSACPESLLIDNDMLGAALRATRGIKVNEETLGFETLKKVCLSGVGHYLSADQTLRVMQSEYYYPEFSDRASPVEYEAAGKPVILDKAIKRRDEIIASHYPKHISDETDAAVREDFPIFLSREEMGRK